MSERAIETWEHEERFAAAVAREAGAIVLRWYGDEVHVEWKGRGDPVTEADRDANAHIVAALGREFPGDAVLAEESADDRSRLGRERLWVVDPLAGTREFVDRTGAFVGMVALTFQGRAVAGAIFHPTSRTPPRTPMARGPSPPSRCTLRRRRPSFPRR